MPPRGSERPWRQNFSKNNPIYMMVHSGARGNMVQMRQIAAMRGLVVNPKGEIIARPIKSNFREGLSVLEYFISTHGGRKGQADTALRTADSGYLTRRLVDVSPGRDHPRGGLRHRAWPDQDHRARARAAGSPSTSTSRPRSTPGPLPPMCSAPTVRSCSRPESILATSTSRSWSTPGSRTVKVRSVLTCEAATGTCAMCYGRSLASGKLVDVGEAVGIVAAQSIGEPGTQLTMRTFHTGGVAGDDITQGLPRVVGALRGSSAQGQVADLGGRRTGRRSRTPTGCGRSSSPPTTVRRRPTSPSAAGRACWWRTAIMSRSVSSSPPVRRTRTTCCGCSVCAGCRSTWWTRCSRSTGPRVRRSTTSTSRSSSGRCCAGSR